MEGCSAKSAKTGSGGQNKTSNSEVISQGVTSKSCVNIGEGSGTDWDLLGWCFG